MDGNQWFAPFNSHLEGWKWSQRRGMNPPAAVNSRLKLVRIVDVENCWLAIQQLTRDDDRIDLDSRAEHELNRDGK